MTLGGAGVHCLLRKQLSPGTNLPVAEHNRFCSLGANCDALPPACLFLVVHPWCHCPDNLHLCLHQLWLLGFGLSVSCPQQVFSVVMVAVVCTPVVLVVLLFVLVLDCQCWCIMDTCRGWQFGWGLGFSPYGLCFSTLATLMAFSPFLPCLFLPKTVLR